MRRAAFTLLEILTVVAILAILITLTLYGIGKIADHTKAASTTVTLQSMRSMLSEFETVNKGLNREPAQMYPNKPVLTALGAALDIWHDADPTDAALPEPDALLAPGVVTLDGGAGTVGGRYSWQIANTQLVMGLLQQASNVRAMLGKIPSSQFMETLPPGLANVLITVPNNAGQPVAYGAGASYKPYPPVVLDAWGNPMLFVPSGGLCGVTTNKPGDPGAMVLNGKPTDTTKDSSGNLIPSPYLKIVVNQTDPTKLGANQVGPIKSPDGRPFWASAGPDGNFLTGDDNVYSFEE